MKNLRYLVLAASFLTLSAGLVHAQFKAQPMGEFERPAVNFKTHPKLFSQLKFAKNARAQLRSAIKAHFKLKTRENYVLREEFRGQTESLIHEFQKFLLSGQMSVAQVQQSLEQKYDEMPYDPINDFSAVTNYNAFPGLAKIVRDPQEGILTKILMMRNAQETIDFATYIFQRDEMAFLFLHEISKALERGVSVRILVDAIGSIHWHHGELKALFHGKRGIKKDRQGQLKCDRDIRGELLRDENNQLVNCEYATLEVRLFASWFRPLQWLKNIWISITNIFKTAKHKEQNKDFRFSRRMHDKFLVVDGLNEDRVMVLIGGRNVSNMYYGLPKLTPETFEDMEILVKNDPIRKSHLVTPCIYSVADPRCRLQNPYYDPRRDPNNPLEFQPNGSHLLGTLITSHFEKIFNKTGNVDIAPTFIHYTQTKRRIEQAIKHLNQNLEVYHKYQGMVREQYLSKNFHPVELDFVHELQNYYRGDTPMHETVSEENPQVDGNANSIVQHYRKALMSAKKSIKIVSPYVWLPEDEKQWLRNWLDQDKERTLDIISNSILTTDNPFSQALVDYELGPAFHRQNQNDYIQETYARYRKSPKQRLNYQWCNPYNPLNDQRDIERCRNMFGELPQAVKNRGVARVYGFGKRDSAELPSNKGKKNNHFYGKLHSKYFIIDDATCMVSSHNFDPRSRYHDTESGFLIYGKSFCQALDQEFEILRQRSYVWGSRHWRILRWYPSLKNKTTRLRWLYNAIKWLGLDYLI